MRFLVVCALCAVIETFCPTSWFSKVDLPTFGRPINPINPQR
ncbi:uncharacterized protein METZ01_LOCUS51384 [marine metagenome]|uniref:Uncharacterized protein n=1 Tax=marine metagenome TaxID=408172 RepID=A0A381S397_9ZZZZ